jgi:membrane protease YdiL (CAAX protease family)
MSSTSFQPISSTTTSLSAPEVAFTTEQFGIPRLVVMHLLPGLIIAGGYAVVAWIMRGWNVPPLLPLLVAIPFTLLPAELGYLLYQGRQRHGRLTLRGVIDYGRPLDFRQYAIWIPVTFATTVVLFMILGFIDSFVFQQAFFWWPSWLNPDYVTLREVPPSTLWVTFGLLVLFGNLVGPLVEELYFRGYLLPRMEYLGGWGVVLNGTLFAIYHFWSPWHVVSRAIGILPIGFAARSKRNVIIPIIVHCTLNMVGTLLLFASIL